MIATTMVTAAVCSVSLAGEPEVFSDAGYEADRAAAIEQDRLHLVYATASWCPPCRRMKTTTWVDESVESWVGQHGIVTALDVDEFPQIAGDLGGLSMPTMILFEAGEELGRTVGYQSAADLVAWMEAGRKSELPLPVMDQLRLATDLYYDDRVDESFEQLLDLWERTRWADETFDDVRHGFMAAHIGFVVEAHAPAHQAFSDIRDRDQAALERGEVSWRTLADWIALNGALGDEERTMEWVERIASRENSRSTLDRFSVPNRMQATEVGHWNALALMIDDPAGHARRELAGRAEMIDRWNTEFESEGKPELVLPGNQLDHPVMMGTTIDEAVIAALHADDEGVREQELIAALEELSPHSQAWRVTFLVAADRCGRLQERHVDWIERYSLRESFPGEVPNVDGTGD